MNLVRRRQGGEKVAAVSFVLFGLWTIRGDQLDGEDKRFSFSPFWTVAIAFFVAEMGDKTQLATVVLAAKYKLPLAVWFGTNVGMLIADAIGIVIGIVMGKHIPEWAVKWGASLVFIGFGIYGFHQNVPERILTPVVEAISLLAMVVVGYLLARSSKETPISQPEG